MATIVDVCGIGMIGGSCGAVTTTATRSGTDTTAMIATCNHIIVVIITIIRIVIN